MAKDDGPIAEDNGIQIDECKQMNVRCTERGQRYKVVIKFDEKEPKNAVMEFDCASVPFVVVKAALNAFTDKHADSLDL